MEYIQSTCFWFFLCICAWQDLRRKSVSIASFLVFGIAGLTLLAVQWLLGTGILVLLREHIPAIVPGLILLLICRISRGGVGEGDGIFFMIAGLYLNGEESSLLLISATVLCGVASLLVLSSGIIQGRSNRKATLPFLPFLIPAGLGVLLH